MVDGENTVIGVKTDREIINANKVILATGGKSYPLTGQQVMDIN